MDSFKVDKEDGYLVLRGVSVNAEYGFCAGPSAIFVKESCKYPGDVWIEKDGNRSSGKDIMGVMVLEAGRGSRVSVGIEEGSAGAQSFLRRVYAWLGKDDYYPKFDKSETGLEFFVDYDVVCGSF